MNTFPTRDYRRNSPLQRIALVVALLVVACSGDVPFDPGLTSPPPRTGPIVSDAMLPPMMSASPTAVAQDGDVAYASLMPSTAPQGSLASVRAVVSGSLVWTTVIDGGFDPVAVMAGSGDTIEVVVRDVLGAEVYTSRMAVAAFRRPVVVRTEPPPKKRDVPLNSTVVVVFSEPIDATSLTSASVRLFRGPFSVGGTASLVPGSGAVIAFRPSAQLAANAEYRLVVTTAIRDLQGDALVEGTTVSFRTVAALLGTPASVSISPDTVVMTGATYQLTAVVRDSHGNRLPFQPVTWTSTDPSSLAVSSTGLLTASAAGHYWVTATAGGVWDTAGVIVEAGPPASVTITPAPAVVGVGDTISLTATVRDANARLMKDALVTWTSSDTTIATVTSTGADTSGLVFATVTGVRLGSLSIAATSGAASGTTSVTVGPRVQAVSLNVTPESATVLVQRTARLSATLRDAQGRVTLGHPIVWTSDNPAVATVDANGVVTAVGGGSAAVTAASDGLADTAAVTVPVPGPLLSIGGEWWVGNDVWDLVVDQDGDGYPDTEGIVCRDTGTVTFSQNGHLFAGTSTLAGCPNGATTITDGYVGDTTLTLMAGSCSYTLHAYTPNQPADFNPQRFNGDGYCSSSPYHRTWNGARLGTTVGIVITPASREVSRGRTAQLTANAVDAAGASLPFSISWSSDNPAVATVSASGLVTGIAVGTATITAAADGQSASASVAVTELIFSTVSADYYQTCGTTADSTYCWGQIVADTSGTPLWSTSSVPIPVSGGFRFASVSVGQEHACGLTDTGAAYCWGAAGALGDGTSSPHGRPVAVSGGLTFASISTGAYHTCGVTPAGVAYCWGANALGQLGTGDTTLKYYPVPTPVVGGLVFDSVSAARFHTCGVTRTGIAYCWGQNNYGQLGIGSSDAEAHPTPLAVGGGLTFASVSAGSDSYTCGLTTAGVAHCWGRGGMGQLGIGATNDQAYPSPTPVVGGHEFRAVSTVRGYSSGRTCGVTTAGAALCWGARYIGPGTFVGGPLPVPVAEGFILASLTVGYDHTCGSTPSGQVYCWGGNTMGQLGDGSFVDRSVPVQVVRHP